MDARGRRRLGGAGLLFIAAFLVSSFAVSNSHNQPTGAQALAFARGHRLGLTIEAYAVAIAVIVGVLFYWYLRELLASAEGMRSLATVSFAGALLFAASGAMSAGIDFAMQDMAHHESGAMAQTLSALGYDMTSVAASGGVTLLLGAAAVVIIRSRVLPTWLGWLAIVLAVVALALPFLSGLPAALWTLIASIVLLASRTTVTVGNGSRREPLPVS